MVESLKDQSGPSAAIVLQEEAKNCQLPINNLGMPTVWHFESNHIGVVHPYQANGNDTNVAYILTIYDWVKGTLTKSAHIKLWENPYHSKLYMINMLHYNVESDKCTIVFSNIYVVPGEIPGCKIIEFNYTTAIKNN